MVFHEGITSFFGSVNFRYVGIGLVVIALIAIIWIASRSSNLSWLENSPLRSLGYFGSEGRMVSGRQMASRLVSGIRVTFSLAKMAASAVPNTRLGKLTGRIVKEMFREEAFAMSEEARLMNRAAASWNAGKLIEALGNSEIHDHQFRVALEARIKQHIVNLGTAISSHQMDEETKRFVLEIGSQLTVALVQLANSEKFEVQIRRRAFDATRKWLDICETSSKRAATVEARARRWEKRLARDLSRQIKALANALRKKQWKAEKTAMDLRSSLEGRRPEVIKAATEKYRMIGSNAQLLTASLEQLREQSKRMVGTINKIISDLAQAQAQFNLARQLEKNLERLEEDVNKDGENLRKYASAIQLRFSSMHDSQVDDIVLQLTADTAAVFESIIKMMGKISDMDNKELLHEVESVQNAIEISFRAEEATRIAESYFERLIEAYAGFEKLAKSADLSEEISQESLQREIGLEEMEEKIARGEESIAGEVRGFFLKTRNVIQESKIAIMRHIEVLNNLIELTTGTKKFILDSLERIITNLHQFKTAMNQEFQQAAAAFQEKFAQARSAQTLERIAA